MSEGSGTPIRDGELRRSGVERAVSILSLMGIVLLSIVVLLMTIATFAGYRFGNMVKREVSVLFEGAPHFQRGAPPQMPAVTALPAPLARYLEYVFSGPPHRISRVFLRHDGEFRTREESRWLPVYAEEYFRADQPGFVWHARVFILPRCFWFEARDMLIGNTAGMLVRLGSVLKVADVSGDEVYRADLLRWLAEAPLFPYAFVSGWIKWAPAGPDSVTATLEYGGQSVSGVFHFDSAGRIIRFEAPGRHRMVDGKQVLTPWSGTFDEYIGRNGVMVPSRLGAMWNLPSGDFVYGRFRVLSLDYDNPPR